VVIGLFVVRGCAGFVSQYALAWAALRGVLQIRQAMFEHLLTSAPALFSRHSASSLTNTLVYEVQNGANQLVGGVNTLLKDSLAAVSLLAYLLWLNWQLTLFIGVLFPVFALTIRIVSRRLQRLTVAGQSATDDLAYVVEENVLAWRIVRLHGAAASETARFDRSSQLLRRLTLKSVAAGATLTPITQVLAACALSAVVVMALWQSHGSAASVGSFVSFLTAMLMLITPIRHLSDVLVPITRGLVGLERGMDLIDDCPVEQGGPYIGTQAARALRLDNVCLRYRVDQPPALDRVTLDLHAGETVALVGPSGAGKTSLVNLLPRFIEPTSGCIELGGHALQDWDIAALRRQFALVSQDVVLFNDTLALNVALGRGADQPPDLDRVRSALQSANLLDFALGLPQGLDTLIGHNGNQLSGGQRQRLAIARALYKDAPILILDEATSALDAESEHAVQTALDRLMVGRTTLVIAHRLATIERADRIVVMAEGRIVEQGSHAELKAAEGLYARLHAMQFRT
jgi:subfamily B ATP-binding cassette protein MsbA